MTVEAVVKLISDLPAGPTPLAGTELMEIQVGTEVGDSQQTTAAAVAQIALRQSVQSIQEGTGGVVVDNTNPNSPKVSVPVPAAGRLMEIDNTNPEAPVYNSTAPTDGGISAAIGSPGGSTLTVGQSISAIVPSGYTLTGWKIQTDVTGSVTVDIRNANLGTTPVTMVGTGNAPSVSGASSGSATIAGWTSTSIAQGTVVEFVITATATIAWVNIALLGNKT